MNKMYDILEICLNEIKHGSDVDTVLLRYPEFADELRPILEVSVKAKGLAVPAPSQEAIKRNRAKLLQHAAMMREAKATPMSRRVWSVPLRRALVTFVVVAMLFMSGTGLVRASSNTLPGDNLYPVKRTWEDVLVLLTFDMNKREILELEYENERLDEVHELFAEGRSAQVDFSGYVTRQSGDMWRVSGISIFISPQTRLPDQQVLAGAAVRVKAQLQDGRVVADQIDLLPAGSKLPEVDDNENEQEGITLSNNEASGTGSGEDAPKVQISQTPISKFEPKNETIQGTVDSIENNLVVINGIVMDIRRAEVNGTPNIGAGVKVDGYYDSNGVFVVTNIEFESKSANDGSGSDSSKEKSGDSENESDKD